MTDKATPRPWRISPLFTENGMADNSGNIVILAGNDPDVFPVAHAALTVDAKRGTAWKTPDPTRDANADLIVRAVNANDALVEALRTVALMYKELPPTQAGWDNAARKCIHALKVVGVEP